MYRIYSIGSRAEGAESVGSGAKGAQLIGSGSHAVETGAAGSQMLLETSRWTESGQAKEVRSYINRAEAGDRRHTLRDKGRQRTNLQHVLDRLH